MEIRYFTETYVEEYGSVFRISDYRAMGIAEDMQGYKVANATEILNSMADFKDDNHARAFMDSIQRADSVIVFMKDAVYPDQIANVYEVILS